MNDAQCQIRRAVASDAAAVADLACELAQSFTFSQTRFDLSYPALLASDGACLLLAVNGAERLGYLLGFEHLTFYANGPVAWVEEVFVRGRASRLRRRPGPDERVRAVSGRPGLRAGRAGDPAGSTLLPRPGYEESAIYHRKILHARQGNSPVRGMTVTRPAAVTGQKARPKLRDLRARISC